MPRSSACSMSGGRGPPGTPLFSGWGGRRGLPPPRGGGSRVPRGLDERPGWTASQALHWLYVDPRLDAHRRTMAQAARMAAGCVSPLARMWLLEALETSGQAWFAAAMEPAEDVERGTGGRLDYLAGRCEITSPDDGRFRQQRLSTPEC